MSRPDDSRRIEQVYFGGGPARKLESLMAQLHGVTGTRRGAMGGWTVSPSREQLNSGLTGHAEVVEVDFDTNSTNLRHLLKAFFSFHDATVDRTEVRGGQHRSVVFCRKAKQNIVTRRAIDLLASNGLEVSTRVKDAGIFWPSTPANAHYARSASRHLRVVREDELEDMSLLEAARSTLPTAA